MWGSQGIRACASRDASVGGSLHAGTGCWYLGAAGSRSKLAESPDKKSIAGSAAQGDAPLSIRLSASEDLTGLLHGSPSRVAPPKLPRERALCAVCQLPVKGLAWHCGTCGHGGHHACMMRWMKVADRCAGMHGTFGGQCPAACGCECVLVICQPVPEESAPSKRATSRRGSEDSQPEKKAQEGQQQKRTSLASSLDMLLDDSAPGSSSLEPGGEAFDYFATTKEKSLRPLPVPLALSAAAETYRKNYREFRKGGAKGAKGEVSSEALAASSVRASKAQHRRTSSGGVSLAVRALLPQDALPESIMESQPLTTQPQQQQQRTPSEEQPSFDLFAALRGAFI